MSSPEALNRPRRTSFGKMASLFCFGEPRVHEPADPLEAEAYKTGAIKQVGKDPVEVLVEARSRLVVGTPVNLVKPTQLQSVEEDLRKEKEKSAVLRNRLQRLTAELTEERARSTRIQAKEAEVQERLVVARMVAKTQLRAVASVITEDLASEAAKQREHELKVLREESRRREEDLTAKVVRLSEQVAEARDLDKQRKDRFKELMARDMEKTQKLQAANKRAKKMEAQLKDMVDKANEMEQLRRDKFKELMARDLEKNQELQAANKKAEEMEKQLKDMRSEVESLQEALVQLPVLPEEDCGYIKDLGEGTYGKVTLRCIRVAVKEMKEPGDALSLLKEQHTMARLRHQAIPGAMAWMQKKDGTRGLAIQYVNGQSMEQFGMKRRAGKKLDLDPTGSVGLSVLERLIEPIEHIHECGHVHRDVSCRNTMLCQDYEGKFNPYLIDFGMAYDMRKPPTGWGGSPGFMRPAVVLCPHMMGPEDDVRGFCAVAWEFLSGRDIWETLYGDCKAAIQANFSIEDDIQSCCVEHGCNPRDIVQCLAAAECLGHIGIGEEYFEPLLKNPRMPATALRLIARGLSQRVARGEEAPPSLADIRAALVADCKQAEVAEAMSLLGVRL
ncbi:probable serine/threonine-protein kinase PknK at C-terminar half [Coccomyxa sp. Obi]|nr:probable serine/threonine-protein kinase PknK at C-terminar half [Coccomyxa sp. Obi]